MPKAELPTTLKGWIIAMVSSAIGFIAGFVSLNLMSRWAR